ncbi:MAG: SsrA-binding protein [Chlamydiae bacterium SM23_39]|nr:MAG: SsrA-binding protein [Chlamydiae bacterium SM23_39]
MKNSNILVSNKKAYHNYEILETFEAGIVLKGSEIKSIRNHAASIQDAYITIKKGEAWLINASISPYRFGGLFNHEEKRDKKLLLHKKEILKLQKIIQTKPYTIIPLSLYLKNGYIKVKIGLAKGKKIYEKREKIKEKEAKKIIKKF